MLRYFIPLLVAGLGCRPSPEEHQAPPPQAEVGALSPRDVLGRAIRTLHGSATLLVECDVASTSQPKQKFRLLCKRPDHARLETVETSRSGTWYTIFDGHAGWTYFPNMNKYFNLGFHLPDDSAWLDLKVGQVASLFFQDDPDSALGNARELSLRRAQFEGSACDVLSWKDETIANGRFELWIDSAGMVRRYRQTGSTVEYKGRGKTEPTDEDWTDTITYTKLELGPEVPDKLLVFDPPEGARALNRKADDSMLPLNSEAPDFQATDLEGRPVKLSDFRGKAVLVNFWFYDCPACHTEFSKLQKLWAEFSSKGLVVLAVNRGDDAARIKKFFREAGLSFTPLRQKDEEISDAYGVIGYPSNYLISPQGMIILRFGGYLEKDLREALGRIYSR
jgi:peroxiredoxin/outer membrane lipoprotein-sorting protein